MTTKTTKEKEWESVFYGTKCSPSCAMREGRGNGLAQTAQYFKVCDLFWVACAVRLYFTRIALLVRFGLPIFFFFRVHIATAASAATYMIIYISTHTSEWGAGAKCTFIWFDLISFNLTFHYFWFINTSNCRCYYYHYHLFISRSFSLFLPFSTILGIWHAAAQLWLVQTF